MTECPSWTIVLPGLDSANWQKIATAARNACKDAEEEFGCPINLIVQGPAGESDAEGYIACLENVIASEDLDGLIVASLYPDPVVPIVAEASSMGIWVSLCTHLRDTFPTNIWLLQTASLPLSSTPS